MKRNMRLWLVLGGLTAALAATTVNAQSRGGGGGGRGGGGGGSGRPSAGGSMGGGSMGGGRPTSSGNMGGGGPPRSGGSTSGGHPPSGGGHPTSGGYHGNGNYHGNGSHHGGHYGGGGYYGHGGYPYYGYGYGYPGVGIGIGLGIGLASSSYYGGGGYYGRGGYYGDGGGYAVYSAQPYATTGQTLILDSSATAAQPQQPPAQGSSLSAYPLSPTKVRMLIVVPAPDARLTINSQATEQNGMERLFDSPTMESGKTYVYALQATWTQEGQQVVRRKSIDVEVGKEYMIDLRREAELAPPPLAKPLPQPQQ